MPQEPGCSGDWMQRGAQCPHHPTAPLLHLFLMHIGLPLGANAKLAEAGEAMALRLQQLRGAAASLRAQPRAWAH